MGQGSTGWYTALMQRSGGRASSVLAAFALAAVTLAVFGSQQHAGPESAVRAFHEAVVADDVRRAQSVLLQAFELSPPARALASEIQTNLKRGVTYRMTNVRRSATRAVVTVDYELHGRTVQNINWYVVFERSQWLIDAEKTYLLLPRLYLGAGGSQ